MVASSLFQTALSTCLAQVSLFPIPKVLFPFLFIYDYLMYTLLPDDRVHAISADIRKIIKPRPVVDRVTEVEVAAMITIESTHSKKLFRFFLFFISLFWFMVFIVEVRNHFFKVWYG